MAVLFSCGNVAFAHDRVRKCASTILSLLIFSKCISRNRSKTWEFSVRRINDKLYFSGISLNCNQSIML